MTWAALFDMDGTMVDNRRYHEAAWLEFGKRRVFDITPEFYRKRMHSRSNREIARILLGDDIDEDTAWQISDAKEAVYRELYRNEMSAMPGLIRLLRELAEAGIPCATVSNSPPENVDMVLDGLAIRTLFDVVVHRRQVKQGKPHPELLLTGCDRLGISPGRCLVFEDSVSGFGAAEAAGTPYVVVTAGADPDELVHANIPVATVRDFTDVDVPTMRTWLAPACS